MPTMIMIWSKKYKLATLWNCSNKLQGKKVRRVYFDVLM